MGVPLAAGAALAGVQIVASLLEGQANKKALSAQADASDENALIAARAATDAAQRGDYAATQRKAEVGKVAGEQALRYSASGVDSSSGTPADTIAQTRAVGDLDALMIQNTAASEAYGYAVRADQHRKAAKLQRQGADAALPLSLVSGTTKAAASFLPFAYPRIRE